MIHNNIMIISLQFSMYEDLFNDFDYNSLENKVLREDIDSFIKNFFKDMIPGQMPQLTLIFPKSIYSIDKEQSILKAIQTYYSSELTFQNRIARMVLKRIIYYTIVSFLLFVIWYYTTKTFGDTLFTAAANTGATVLLWQVMTLLFIERDNFELHYNTTKALSHMPIIFKYIESTN